VRQLVEAGRIQHLPGDFAARWLDGAWLVVAATDDKTVNRAVAAAAEERRIWANVVDDLELSSYQSPARIERGPLQIAISSGGGAPMLARHLREKLETELDESLADLATLLLRERRRIRIRHPRLSERRRFFETLLKGPVAERFRAGDAEGARQAFEAALAEIPTSRDIGSVALVGAGPGDPGLLTLRALRLLNQADVILHDRLVSEGVLALARRDAEFIEVGKQAANHHVTQDGIHTLMLEHARAGRRVVRLKGGDIENVECTDEEIGTCRKVGIPVEIVRGVARSADVPDAVQRVA
jgi:uroporphyrin-III C-methyltransferase/precorrin-2 dehydrogenase/sirohydrochlorin ferrochelatase